MNATKRDAGGLPATGPFVDRLIRIFRDKPHDDTSALVLLEYGELCRAAPAGGEPKAPVFPSAVGPVIHEVGQAMWLLPDGADKARARLKNAMDLLRALQHIPPVDSAPAGSGEVSELVERLESTAGAYPEDVFTPLTDEQKKTYGWIVQAASAGMGRHMAPLLLEAANKLRALSRGLPEDAVGSHFYAACERACGELPAGWEVRVCLENGAGTVELCSPDGFSEYMDVDDDDRLTAEVNAAVDAAIAAQRKEGE